MCVLLILCWIGSYPVVLSWMSGENRQASPSGRASIDECLWYERQFGYTATYRREIGPSCFVIVLWKGSIHFMFFENRRDVFGNMGFDISRSAFVFANIGRGTGTLQQIYVDKLNLNFLGFGAIDSRKSGNVPLRAVAIPLWPALLPVVWWLFSLFRSRYRRRRGNFEVIVREENEETPLISNPKPRV
jgi:hypothetical protein